MYQGNLATYCLRIVTVAVRAFDAISFFNFFVRPIFECFVECLLTLFSRQKVEEIFLLEMKNKSDGISREVFLFESRS